MLLFCLPLFGLNSLVDSNDKIIMKCKIAPETKIFMWFILGVVAMIPVMGLCQSTPLKAPTIEL